MNETLVCSEMVYTTAIDATGKKAITVNSTDKQKSRVLVVIAAKADRTKLKPMIVFDEGDDEEIDILRIICRIVYPIF